MDSDTVLGSSGKAAKAVLRTASSRALSRSSSAASLNHLSGERYGSALNRHSASQLITVWLCRSKIGWKTMS